jgi:predicted nicotinamide N-methyase
VLELGAGQGLGSLCAALLGAARVVSTDLDQPPATRDADHRAAPSLLRLIARNRDAHATAVLAAAAACAGTRGAGAGSTRANASGCLSLGAERAGAPSKREVEQVWRVEPLRWGDPRQATSALDALGGGCDLVLASECAYDDTSFGALLATLDSMCHPAAGGGGGGHATEVLLCHYPRTQAGGAVPELCAFEAQASAQGFAVRRAEVTGAATGVTYVLHSLTKRAAAAAAPNPT